VVVSTVHWARGQFTPTGTSPEIVNCSELAFEAAVDGGASFLMKTVTVTGRFNFVLPLTSVA